MVKPYAESMLRRNSLPLLLACAALFGAVRSASAIEVRISSQALERTLKTQLFNGPEGRYYMRGNLNSACYVYADSPRVSFEQDRVVVHVHTRAKLGTSVRGICIGVSLDTDADVSMVPEAREQTIGFRHAHIQHLSESKELNFLLIPFLDRKLPDQMKVNAADLMRQLLSRSVESTGYAFSLTALKLHSLVVENNMLVLDADAGLDVN